MGMSHQDRSGFRSRLDAQISRRAVVGGAIGSTALAAAGGIALPGSSSLAASQGQPLEIIIGTLGDANSINPFLVSDSEGEWRAKILFDEFVRNDPVSFEPLPGIAESWTVNDLVITFKVRAGVTFSDGSPLTAEDVAFTIQGFLSPETGSPNQSKFLAIAGAQELVDGTATPVSGTATPVGSTTTSVSGIRVVDPQTIEFTLAQPDAAFIYNMRYAWIVPKALLVGKNLVDDPYFQAPVSAGPFMFESWEGNDFVAVKNPAFWESPKPAITRVTHRLIADSQALVLALQNNEIDGSNYPNPAGEAELRSNADLDLIVPPFGSPNGWMFNCRHELLAKKEVRRAIAMALDCNQFAADSLLGLSKAGLGPIAPESWAHDPTLEPIPYDPATARQMITDAGAEGATLAFFVNAGNILREDWLTYTQQALEEIGITVDAQTGDYAVHQTAVTENHDFVVSGVDFAGVAADPSALREQFHSRSSGNYSGYSNPALDELLDQAKATIDQEAAIPIYARIQRIIMDEVPMHFAWYRPFLHAINKTKFAGYQSSGPYGAFYFLQDWTAAGQA